jgi:hypothetical protein
MDFKQKKSKSSLQTEIPCFVKKINDKARNLLGWMEWIIENHLPVSATALPSEKRQRTAIEPPVDGEEQRDEDIYGKLIHVVLFSTIVERLHRGRACTQSN